MTGSPVIRTQPDTSHQLSVPTLLMIDVEPLGPFGASPAVVNACHDLLRTVSGDFGLVMGTFVSLAIEAYVRGDEGGALLALDHAAYLAQAETERQLLAVDA